MANAYHHTFDGSSAVVLGGTGALGATICRFLAANGLDIGFSYGRNAAKASALAEELSGTGRTARFSQTSLDAPDTITQFVNDSADQLADIGVAVYAAGPDLGQPFMSQIEMDEWQRIIHADIDGFFAFAKAVLPIFRKRGGGALIAITTTAVERYAIRDALSAVPKAAVEVAVKAIAKEEGRNGIRANCVAPGMLDVGLGQRMLETEYPGDATETIRRNLPLQCFGTADDIAHAAMFLASTASRYTTGQVLAVDGGWQI